MYPGNFILAEFATWHFRSTLQICGNLMVFCSWLDATSRVSVRFSEYSWCFLYQFFLGFGHLKRRACHVHATWTIPSPQSWLSFSPQQMSKNQSSWCHKFIGNICRFRPECISQPPLIIFNLFFHVVQLSEFLKEFFIHSKGKITSVLCLWAQWCETIKHQEMPSMRQTNQDQCWMFPGKSTATEPSQMEKTHFEWQHFKRGTITERCSAHTWRYISNISCMFKYIAGTNWNALSCIFCFFRCTFVNMTPPPNHLKEAYLRKCFQFVCLQDLHLCRFFSIHRCNCPRLSQFVLVCPRLSPFKRLVSHLLRRHISGQILDGVNVNLCVFVFAGVQPPVGRTSPQRTGWWCPCLPVRPEPGSSRPSWPVTCWWPTYCWSTCSSLSSSTWTRPS